MGISLKVWQGVCHGLLAGVGFIIFAAAGLGLLACTHASDRAYTEVSSDLIMGYKEVALPFPSGTSFYLSQGAFGKNTHHDPGEEYKWDLDVPYDTPVLAVEDGIVYAVWETNKPGACDPLYNESPNNLKVQHADGTVAQYVHVKSLVRVGQVVKRGEPIAKTAKNGFICSPQLCFSVYRSTHALHGSLKPQTVPLRFMGIPRGLLREGESYQVP